MSQTNYFQCNFTMGEVAPELYNRLDTDQYRAAAKKVNNGVPIPQGGITKRRGFKKLLELTPTPRGGGLVKMIPLEVGESVQFICLINMDGSFDFYTAGGAFLQTITPLPRAPATNYDETGTRFIRGTDIKDVQWANTLDPTEVLLTHPLYPPITIKYLGSNEFSVARTVFQQYVPKAAVVHEDAATETYLWSPYFNGTSHVSFPRYMLDWTFEQPGEVFFTPFECTFTANLYMDTNANTGWYSFTGVWDPEAKKYRPVYIHWDKDKKKYTGMKWTDEDGLPEYHYKVEFAFESSDSDAHVEIYSQYTGHVGGKIFSPRQVIYVNIDGKRVFTFDQTRFGRTLVLFMFQQVGSGFQGTITDVRISGSGGVAHYPLKIIGTTRPTTTDLGDKAVLVQPATPNSWIKIGLGDGGTLPPGEGEGGIVPPDTSNPFPSYNGYVPIHAPKDNFGYTRYLSSPWDTMQLTFNATNGDIFELKYDGSADSAPLTYNVVHEHVTDATVDGDTVGDTAESMVVAMTAMMTKWGEDNFNVVADYTTTHKTLYNSKGPVSVKERTFLGITVRLPTQDFDHPKRIWCLDKSDFQSMMLVRPIGGTIQQIPTSDQELYKGEDAWSDNRGYPAVTLVHGGRGVYGGSYAKPLGLWFSQSGLGQHFSPDNLEEPLANDSISAILNSPTVGSITGMVSGRTLLVLTSTAIMSVTGESGIISPLSFSAKVEAQHGSKYVKPVFMDNKNFYIHSDTATLNSTAFDFTKDAYLMNVESLFSPHLMRDVAEMASVDSLSQANATYLVLRNNSGTLSTYSSIGEQGITSWSRFTTDGYVRGIATLSENLFIVVERGGRVFLEAMAPDTPFADNSVRLISSLPLEYIAGLDYLAGKEISVLADGYPFTATVQDNGTMLIPFPALDVTYGLPIQFEVQTLPPPIQLKGKAFTAYEKKRISSVKVSLMDTLDATIRYCGRDYTIPNQTMGGWEGQLFEPPVPVSGLFTKRLVGWSVDGSVSVVSTAAVPTTLLAMEKDVRLKG